MINNPVIPGFHPDPSVCRRGDDFYLVTSTFEFFPGVPIFHSRDLVNWRQIGHCLTRKSQLDLTGIGSSSGIFAPTIRYHAGRFYMITTVMGGCGNFYVSAEQPEGPWSDPILVDASDFDPSLFFDDDGTVYYTRRGQGLVQATIDIATGKLTSELKIICSGFLSRDIEGPHLYKIRGWYYLMAAEGGTRFGHSATIGRSRSPWGPFESCPTNPILTHRHRSHRLIRDTGHVELIEDARGNWWALCLATRQLRYDSASILGRETFLAPVTWSSDGWPQIGTDGQIDEQIEVPGVQQQDLFSAERDDFDQPTLTPTWQHLRNPHAEDYSLSARPGHLRLHGSAVTLDDRDSPAFVCRRQQHFNALVSCRLDFQPQRDHEEAGLSIFANERFHYDVLITRRAGRRLLLTRKHIDDLVKETVHELPGFGGETLAIRAQGDVYQLGHIPAQGAFTMLDSGLSRLLGPEIAGNGFGSWTGNMFGIFASGNGAVSTAPADFDFFDYRAEK